MKKIIYLLGIVTLFYSCQEDHLTDNHYIGGDEAEKKLKALVLGNYANLRASDDVNNRDLFGQKTLDLGTDLMSGDMVIISNATFFTDYYNYSGYVRNSTSKETEYFYERVYFPIIKTANQIISLANEQGGDNEEIIAEAKAQRAYAYLFLARMYQQAYSVNPSALAVPLLAPDKGINIRKRASLKEVYDLIIQDLTEAEPLLLTGNDSNLNKNLINTNVAQGLLARAYLEIEDYANASFYANSARQGYKLLNEDSILEGFNELKLTEVMFGYKINSNNSGSYISFISHMDKNQNGYAEYDAKAMDQSLYDKMGDNDIRKEWFDPDDENLENFIMKFKNDDAKGYFTADEIYMRAAEMYYIEAESKTRMGDEAGAIDVLKEITLTRDPDYDTNATGQDLLDEIIDQKRIELFAEGITFWDMKRLKREVERGGSNQTNNINIPAGDYRLVFQLPESEIERNPELTNQDQNP